MSARRPGTTRCFRPDAVRSAPWSSGWALCALSFYLVLYLLSSRTILDGLWFRGGHGTAEQWAYHVLLEELGFRQHHGAVESRRPNDSSALSDGDAEEFAPAQPQITTAPLHFSVAPETVSLQLALIAGVLLILLADRRQRVRSRRQVAFFWPEPPERPPNPR